MDELTQPILSTLDLRQIAWVVGSLAFAVGGGLILHRLLWWTFSSVARRTHTALDDSLSRHCRRPTMLIAPIVLVYVMLPLLGQHVGPASLGLIRNVLQVLLPVALGWTLVKLTSVFQETVLGRYDIAGPDNLEARAVHTQFRIIRRIAVVAIAVMTLAFVLMTFEDLRRLGTGLLASAGVAGIVLGFAAQRTLGNLLAGIQIALSQPIRIDDVVVVEGEWGRIEEITLTYVVVRIWDKRRLVLPISYFLEKPFQNWTRVSSEILGTVFLHVDHRVPVDAVREELKRIVEASEHWDGQVAGVVMTDTSPDGVTLRALVSAANSARAWDLRCEVREKLVAFLRERYPDALPRVRAELEPGWPEGPRSSEREPDPRSIDAGSRR